MYGGVLVLVLVLWSDVQVCVCYVSNHDIGIYMVPPLGDVMLQAKTIMHKLWRRRGPPVLAYGNPVFFNVHPGMDSVVQ